MIFLNNERGFVGCAVLPFPASRKMNKDMMTLVNGKHCAPSPPSYKALVNDKNTLFVAV